MPPMGKEIHLPNCLWMGYVSSQEGIHLFVFFLFYQCDLLMNPFLDSTGSPAFVPIPGGGWLGLIKLIQHGATLTLKILHRMSQGTLATSGGFQRWLRWLLSGLGLCFVGIIYYARDGGGRWDAIILVELVHVVDATVHMVNLSQ